MRVNGNKWLKYTCHLFVVTPQSAVLDSRSLSIKFNVFFFLLDSAAIVVNINFIELVRFSLFYTLFACKLLFWLNEYVTD